MLKPRFHPLLTLLSLTGLHGLVTFININCGLYRVFPQQVFFLLTSAGMVFFLYRGKSGKKIMIVILMDGLGYTSCFVFLPLVHYAAIRVRADSLFLFNRIYDLCDVLTTVFYAVVLEWIVKKYRNLQGDTTMEGNLYLLILSFFIRQSVIYYGTTQLDSGNDSLAAVCFMTLTALAGVILLVFSVYYVDRRLVLALAKQQNTFLGNQITAWKEEEKQLAGFRHDFKNHMLCLKNLLRSGNTGEAEEYLNSISRTVNSLSPDISTGNVYADAILREKLALAQAGGICLKTDLIFPPPEMLSPTDLCIILSNALDNALEACRKIPAGGPERNIQAISYVRHSCLLLEIKNPVPPSLKQETRLFQSTKEDPRYHGIGLSNIREAVERCHGTLELNVTEEVFHFCAMFPLGSEA